MERTSQFPEKHSRTGVKILIHCLPPSFPLSLAPLPHQKLCCTLYMHKSHFIHLEQTFDLLSSAGILSLIPAYCLQASLSRLILSFIQVPVYYHLLRDPVHAQANALK